LIHAVDADPADIGVGPVSEYSRSPAPHPAGGAVFRSRLNLYDARRGKNQQKKSQSEKQFSPLFEKFEDFHGFIFFSLLDKYYTLHPENRTRAVKGFPKIGKMR
jgi:hypothetical protein